MKKLAAAYAIESLGLSKRRACLLTGISSSVYRYQSKQGDDDILRLRMRELAGERKRLGSPRLHIMLKREDDAGIVDCSAHTERKGQSRRQTAVTPGWEQPSQPGGFAIGTEIIIYYYGGLPHFHYNKRVKSGKLLGNASAVNLPKIGLISQEFPTFRLPEI